MVQQYLDHCKQILTNRRSNFKGGSKESGLISLFGYQNEYDLREGFPLLTTKKMHTDSIIHELVWFLRGETNIKYLEDNKCSIWRADTFQHNLPDMIKAGIFPAGMKKYSPEWDEAMKEYGKKIREEPGFSEEWGESGPIYGRQWRKWQSSDGRLIDQLQWAIWKTKNYPDRKHVCVSAWNPEFIYEMSKPGTTMAIPPCHVLYNINVTNNKLSLLLYQRSCDAFLGVPFNIASYALLTMILAQVCGYEPGEFIHTYGDIHVYGNHYEQVKEQISRTPRPFPKIWINPEKKNIDDFTIDDFKIIDYDPHPAIKGEITAVGGFNEKERIDFKNKEKSLMQNSKQSLLG